MKSNKQTTTLSGINMKVLTINELIELMLNSPDYSERLHGNILLQCDFKADEDYEFIANGFENNALVIYYNPTALFEEDVDIQKGILQYIASLIEMDSLNEGTGKLQTAWNMACAFIIIQKIDNIPEAGNLFNNFDFPKGLSVDEYYELVKAHEEYDSKVDRIFEEPPHSQIAVTQIVNEVAKTHTERRASTRVERRKEVR